MFTESNCGILWQRGMRLNRHANFVKWTFSTIRLTLGPRACNRERRRPFPYQSLLRLADLHGHMHRALAARYYRNTGLNAFLEARLGNAHAILGRNVRAWDGAARRIGDRPRDVSEQKSPANIQLSQHTRLTSGLRLCLKRPVVQKRTATPTAAALHAYRASITLTVQLVERLGMILRITVTDKCFAARLFGREGKGKTDSWSGTKLSARQVGPAEPGNSYRKRREIAGL